MIDQSKSSPLATVSVPRLMLKMALPSVVAQIVNLLYNIVDRIYIGHIPEVGADALTGVGLCMPMILLVNAFAMLGAAGGAPRAAIALGQGNRKEAERIMSNCFSMLLLFGLVLTAIYIAFAEPFLWLFGASDATIGYALEYLYVYAIGTVFTLLVLGMNSFLTAQGFSTFAMLTTLIGAGLNILLDPLFIFTFGMGVRGAAIATVISQAVSFLWVLHFLVLGKRTHLRLNRLRLQRSVCMPCLALGASGFVMLSTEAILNICFNSSLSRYGGDIAVGSMTIISSCVNLVLLPCSGICQGCQPIISYNFGARNMDRVKKCVTLQITVCAVYTLLFWGFCMLLPQVLAGVFSNDSQLVEYTVWTMRVYMAGIFAMGLQTSCQQSFVALGQAKVSLLLACLRKLVLLIPLIYLFPLLLENKVFAIFLAEPVSDVIAAAVTVTVFILQFKKILKNGPALIGQEKERPC